MGIETELELELELKLELESESELDLELELELGPLEMLEVPWPEVPDESEDDPPSKTLVSSCPQLK